MDFSKYSLPELSGGLSLLRQYKTMLRQAGKKGKIIFEERQNPVKKYRIEYAPGVDQDFLMTEALGVIHKTFREDVISEDCIFSLNPDLVAGMRIFYEDDMVDVSFQNLEKSFRSIAL